MPYKSKSWFPALGMASREDDPTTCRYGCIDYAMLEMQIRSGSRPKWKERSHGTKIAGLHFYFS